MDSVRIGQRNPYPANCSLFVWRNLDTLPDVANPTFKMEYAAATCSEMTWIWQTVALPSPIACSTDFWVGIWIPENSSTRALSDASLDFSWRMAWKWDYGWLIARTADGDFKIRAIVSTVGTEETYPTLKLVLNENYPNPVTDKTTIAYTISQATKVKLEIYDITGRNIKTLVNGIQTAGEKEIVWDRTNNKGEQVASGIYFYSLNMEHPAMAVTKNKSLVKTLIVL